MTEDEASGEWRSFYRQSLVQLPRDGWRGRLDLLIAAITGRRLGTEPVVVAIYGYVRSDAPIKVDLCGLELTMRKT